MIKTRYGLLFLLLVAAVRLPFLSGDLGDMDSWRQTETATQAKNFLEDPNPLHPRVDWGEPGPGYVESEFPLYTYAVHLLYRVFGPAPILGRCLSLALFLCSLVPFTRIASRWFGPGGVFLALCFYAFAPITVRYSRAFMPEAAVLLFYLLALDAFLQDAVDRRRGALLQAALWTALAILVKPTAIHIGLVYALVLWKSWGGAALVRPRRLLFGFFCLAPAVAWYAYGAHLHAVYGNTFGVVSGGDSKWGDLSWWTDPRFYAELLRIETVWVLGVPGLLLAAVGLVRPPAPGLRTLRAGFLALFVYYLAVARYAGHEGRGTQYHIYAAPWMAWAATAGLTAVLEWRPRWWRLAALLVAVLALEQGLSIGRVWLARHARLEIRAGRALARLAAPGDLAVVATAEPRVDRRGAANNFEDPRILYYARLRGRVLPVDGRTPAELEHALLCGARWFVDLDRAARHDGPDFRAALRRLCEPIARGDGFRIYRVRHPRRDPSRFPPHSRR